MNRKITIALSVVLSLVVISVIFLNFYDRWGDEEIIDEFVLEDAFPNLRFNELTDMHQQGDYLYAAEQSGVIYSFLNDPSASDKSVFLDISAQVDSGGEKGLLGFAFHPNFTDNGYVFVDYTTKENGNLQTRISRFTSSGSTLDVGTEVIFLEVDQPYSNHNAGQIIFGLDGYLYITLGDGGSGGDPDNNGQDPTTLLGSILRIDVDNQDTGLPYAVPADNPFVGNSDGWREEIYAYGLRNPWRMSQDHVTGKIWLADVGQNKIEEIDILEKGANYGWNIKEGNECYEVDNCEDYTDLVDPVHTYDHSDGVSITGGYVYRGEHTSLVGKYIYGDFSSGKIWALEDDTYTNELVGRFNINIASFAIDDDKLYILSRGDGTIYTFVPAPTETQ